MFGIWLGIPLGLTAFLYADSQLIPYFHDFQAGSAAAAAIGLCIWFFFRGIDILNDRKLDNPEPFASHDSLPLTLGKINEFLKEAQFGPHNWQIRTLDTDETRIMAMMKFQEFINGILPGSHTQLDRMILLNVYLEPKEKTTTGTSTEEKPGTQVTLKFLVDSAVHRAQVNQIVTDTIRHIQELVGAKPIEVKKAPHPLTPPQWIIVLLVCSLVYGVEKKDTFEKQVAADKVAREKAAEEAKERREKFAQQWQQLHNQQQQQGYGISPNNPFAPALGGGGAPPAYQPSANAPAPCSVPEANRYTQLTPLIPPGNWNPPAQQNGGGYDVLQPRYQRQVSPVDPWKTPYSDLQPKNGAFTGTPENSNSENNSAPTWRSSY